MRVFCYGLTTTLHPEGGIHMLCKDCPWYWQNEDDFFAHCQYPYEDGCAPCEEDEEE